MGDIHKIGTSVRRLPGQSLREEIDRRFDNGVTLPLFCVGAGLAFLWFEISHVYFKLRPSVWLGVVVFAICVGIAAVMIYKTISRIRNLRRGEQGELMVAQAIERDLLPNGYVVFHDIQLKDGKRKFNIDHLLVGPQGVFVIETKNYAKPKRGEVKVSYDGWRVCWNGKLHRDDEARQAVATALAAKDYIYNETGLKVFVKPVLCAVGWYAVSNDLFRHPVLLLMEKQLGSLIPKVRFQSPLSEQDRNLIIAKLST